MKTLLFVRHGETQFNEQKRFRGLQDVGLNGDGIVEAMKIRDKFGAGVRRVYASDLSRAQQTANILSGGQATVHTSPFLRPWNVGDFAGQPKNRENKALIERMAKTNETPPGGEPLSAFKRKYHVALSALLDHARDLPDGSSMAVVSHASNIHELSHVIYGDPDAVKVKPGGVVQVGYDPESDQLHATILEGGTAEETS